MSTWLVWRRLTWKSLCRVVVDEEVAVGWWEPEQEQSARIRALEEAERELSLKIMEEKERSDRSSLRALPANTRRL